ncbi:hypothetical protein CC2G_009066 [Coprinopsis cinerea AmutBmut pab1-1]|nr:hypothetical protein CC2G_009066 [Coprinopsis cinerea AmutBmut pab1-1]
MTRYYGLGKDFGTLQKVTLTKAKHCHIRGIYPTTAEVFFRTGNIEGTLTPALLSESTAAGILASTCLKPRQLVHQTWTFFITMHSWLNAPGWGFTISVECSHGCGECVQEKAPISSDGLSGYGSYFKAAIERSTMTEQVKNVRVVLIGVGGATCSGKTTLAKHLNRILPDSVIIHQDDFAPPMEQVPIHPIHNVQDWDAPAGAISWDRLIDSLHVIKSTGKLPEDHRSHDHLNLQKDIPVDSESADRWREKFRLIQQRVVGEKHEKLVFGILDGFLLYWHPKVVEQLDVRIMLRVPHDVLKQRRHERHGYHTAEGALWRDPPGYWEDIVYPAYIEAHRELFTEGDVEHGQLTGNKVEGLVMLETLNMSMTEAVERSCSTITTFLEAQYA